MSNYTRCEKCGEFGDIGHKCAPEWEVAIDGEDYDIRKSFGCDAEVAVLKYMERFFAELDYPEEAEVWVRKPGDTEWQKFDVTVWAVPEFTVAKKE